MERFKRLIDGMLVAVLLTACAPTTTEEVPGESPANAEERARAHTELATAYYSSGQYNVALEEVQKALDADRNYIPAVNQLGLIHLALDQTEDAKRELRRALKLDPDDPSVNNNYGMLLCSLGDSREAMEYFDKALDDPLYVTPEFAYVNAGVCLKNTGDIVGAEQFLRRALALAPEQPTALYQMADVSYSKGDFVSAQSYITRHIQLVIPGPDALWLAARIEHRMGNIVALDAYGAQLNRRFPESPQTRAFNQGQFR